MTLLLAICWWIVLGWAACGAVVLCGCVWFMVTDWLFEPAPIRYSEPAPRRVPPRAAQTCPPLRPYDREDPLEQLFALPDAPDPKWRVA